jgi:hypothetical protein
MTRVGPDYVTMHADIYEWKSLAIVRNLNSNRGTHYTSLGFNPYQYC